MSECLSVRGHPTDEVYEAEAKLCFISLRQLLRVCALVTEASLHFGGLLLTAVRATHVLGLCSG